MVNNQLPTPVEAFTFRGRKIYIKRDDLFHPLLSGNKFRKLHFLLETPKERYKEIISYGGVQSNAMLSLAYIAHLKGWKFTYYSKTLPSYLKEDIQGNLKASLELDMHLIETCHEEYSAQISSLKSTDRCLLIPQGGAVDEAKYGLSILAEEIELFKRETGIRKLNVMTPSGTGVSAFFLARYVKDKVFTTAVVGDSDYLREQFSALGETSSNLEILESQKKYHFGKLYLEFHAIYKELKAQGIEFDLLYSPKMFIALYENMDKIEGDILYVHDGGVLGNASMLKRYEHKEDNKR